MNKMDIIMTICFAVSSIGILSSKGMRNGLIYIGMIVALFVAYAVVVLLFGDAGKLYLLAVLVLFGVVHHIYKKERVEKLMNRLFKI